MADPAELDYLRYEALIESVRRPEKNKREALEEYLSILGRKDPKKYQESLIEATTEYLVHSKQFSEGPHIKYATNLAEEKKLGSDYESENYSPAATVDAFERIVTSSDAHPDVRSKLFTALLQSDTFTTKTLEYIDNHIFEVDLQSEDQEFLEAAREQLLDSVYVGIESKPSPDSQDGKIRKIILDRFAANSLEEEDMIKLTEVMVKKAPWSYGSVFERVIFVDNAPKEVRKKSLEALLEYQKYTAQTVELADKSIFVEATDPEIMESNLELRKLMFGHVVKNLSAKLDPDSPEGKLRNVVLDRFTNNKLTEAEMFRLVVGLVAESPDYMTQLAAVSKLDGVIEVVKTKAEDELKKSR